MAAEPSFDRILFALCVSTRIFDCTLNQIAASQCSHIHTTQRAPRKKRKINYFTIIRVSMCFLVATPIWSYVATMRWASLEAEILLCLSCCPSTKMRRANTCCFLSARRRTTPSALHACTVRTGGTCARHEGSCR